MLDARLARTEGTVRLGFVRAEGQTALARLRQSGAARVRFPKPVAGADPEAVLLNTAGGLTGGDRIDVEVALAARSAATVTSAAAEKIYRALDGDAEVRVRLELDDGARLAWLPQPTIVFDKARLDRRTDVAIAGNASFLAVETLRVRSLGHGRGRAPRGLSRLLARAPRRPAGVRRHVPGGWCRRRRARPDRHARRRAGRRYAAVGRPGCCGTAGRGAWAAGRCAMHRGRQHLECLAGRAPRGAGWPRLACVARASDRVPHRPPGATRMAVLRRCQTLGSDTRNGRWSDASSCSTVSDPEGLTPA